MFNFLKRKKDNNSEQIRNSEEINYLQKEPAPFMNPIDFSCPISEEERETVSVIASAILAGDKPDSVFKVRSVSGIDLDKEAAALAVSAILSEERNNTVFRLKSITEITTEA